MCYVKESKTTISTLKKCAFFFQWGKIDIVSVLQIKIGIQQMPSVFVERMWAIQR